MRVLLVNQFFWPDLAATGLLLTDLVRHLTEDCGHQVTVICGAASYEIAEHSDPPRAAIERVPNARFGRGRLNRLWSYASFYMGASWRMLRAGSRTDVVVTMTTPPLLSVAGHLMKMLYGTQHYIWEMDLYPDVAVDLQVMGERSPVTRIVGALADYSRRRADGVIALGECMKRRLIARGVREDKIQIAHNWADGQRIRPPTYRISEQLTLAYAGHLGLAHDIDTIAGAMEQLWQQEVPCRFVFVGGGARLVELKQRCADRNIGSAEFHAFCDRDQLNELLAQADIGLVTQREECNGSLVPSKIYAQLAAGLPLLYIGPESATPGLIIRDFDCGWQVGCGDVAGLVHLLRTLAYDRQYVSAKGDLARAVFLDEFDRPLGVSRIARILGLEKPLASTAAVAAAVAGSTSVSEEQPLPASGSR